MSILKEISVKEGRRLIEETRRKALDASWFSEETRKYPTDALPGQAGRRPLVMGEVEDNITDLIVSYEFEDGSRLVGKFFLPVVKTRPWLGFHGLDDRGLGIEMRMELMNVATFAAARVKVPKGFYYDREHRVLWMEHIGDRIEFLHPRHWDRMLPRIGHAIGRTHAAAVPAQYVSSVENNLFRGYLISYPFMFLEPYLATHRYQDRWHDFIRINDSLERSLIHGDFKQENICLTGQQIWFMDLERSNLANPAYDIGCFLCHLLIEAWDKEIPDAARQLLRFWDAYESEYETGEDYLYCVVNYLILFLAYRTGTHDILSLQNGNTVALLNEALRRGFELADENIPCILQALSDVMKS